MIFGGKKAGEIVLVERRHLETRSTILGTMSPEEWEEHQAPKKKKAAGPTSVDLARSLIDTAKAGLEALREAGKARQKREAAEG